MGTEQSNIIACFVKGDKTNDQAGAGWTVYRENILLKEESLRLGRRNTALQAELITVDRMAQYLLKDNYETDKIMIYTDNQTVLQALDRLMIKTKVCASTFNRNRLRIATQYLSGHATVDYHLHKYRPDIPKLCSYCGDEDETIEHFIADCPKWAFLRLQ